MDETLRGFARREFGEAERSGDDAQRLLLRTHHPTLALEIAAQRLDDAARFGEGHAWEHQREFLAAVTRRLAPPLRAVREQFGEAFEQMVAHDMAEAVVDGLEAVD